MNEYLLISIRPEHVVNILNGNKTIELRRAVPNWVKENIENGKTVKCLIYCTKNKPYLQHFNGYHIFNKLSEYEIILNKTLNGKIVAEFDLNNISVSLFETIEDYSGDMEDVGMRDFKYENTSKKGCISYEDIYKYSNGKDVYALHIENLKTFDTPKGLNEYYTYPKDYSSFERKTVNFNSILSLYDLDIISVKKAPQNMMKVWSSKWINKVTELK